MILESDVLALESQRRAAMLAGDAVTLERLVHPDSPYVHSSGFVDTGGSMTDKIATGVVAYERLDIADQSIRVLEDAAVIVYRQSAALRIAGEPHTSLTLCVAVWAGSDGPHPRLVSFQSGRLAAP